MKIITDKKSLELYDFLFEADINRFQNEIKKLEYNIGERQKLILKIRTEGIYEQYTDDEIGKMWKNRIRKYPKGVNKK